MKKSISIFLCVIFFILCSIIVYGLIHYVTYLIGIRLYYVCVSSLFIVGISFVLSLYVYVKKPTAQESKDNNIIFARLLYILGFSILVSSFVIMCKDVDSEYHGAVIDKEGYLYNEIGIKILDIKGEVKYYDDVIYLMTRDKIYEIDYLGEVLSSKDFIVEGEYGYGFILQNPYKKEFYLRGEKLFSTAYNKISYLGKDDMYDFFACCKHGNIEILNVNKRTGVIDNLSWWGNTFEHVWPFGNPIRCFVVKQGKCGKILDTNGIECVVEEYGIFYPYWDERMSHLYYEDYEGRKLYHQFE